MYNYCCWNMDDMYDEDLQRMYPRIYSRIYPMIMMHCDSLERRYGMMCSIDEEEIEKACEEMYDRIKDEIEDNDDDDKSCCGMRQYGRRRAFNDFLRILLLNELIGRRRRRRRRPRPYYYNYWGY